MIKFILIVILIRLINIKNKIYNKFTIKSV